MTINTPYQPVSLLQCAAGKFDYSLGFTVEDKQDLVVYFGEDGAWPIAAGIDYSISDKAGHGYDTVTLIGASAAALTANHTIAIKRRVVADQPDHYDDYIDVRALGVQLDKVANAVADIGRDVDNSLQFPIGENGKNSGHKPLPAKRALKILSFDADGNPVAVFDIADLVNSKQFADAAELAKLAAAASALAAASAEGNAHNSELAAAESQLLAAAAMDNILSFAYAAVAAVSGDALHANVFISPKLLESNVTVLPGENAIGLFEELGDGVILDVAGDMEIIN